MNGFFTKPLNIQRTTADKVNKPLNALGRTNQSARATHIDFALFGDGFRTAFGALRRKCIRRAFCIACQVFDDLGNNVPCPLHNNAIPGAHSQSGNFIAVVQGYVGHNDAAHRYWGQATHGRQLARPAHLNIDKLKRCFGLFSGKFVRNRPARGFCDKAKPFLPFKPVNLVNHAVNIIGQVRPLTFDTGIMGQRIIAMRHTDEQW